jgi:ferredoxin-NADP reductase
MKLKLLKRKQEAEGTKSFLFRPEKKVNFQPGQYFYLSLPKLNYKDKKGPTRHFTIASSPTEGENLLFATRMRESSGFKKTLDEIKIGSEIDGEGPEGSFILDEKEPGPHVFLAGGIGITPFRSFIKYNIDKKLKTSLTLLYSNSTEKLITFREELEAWSKKYGNFSLFQTISKPEGKWDGLKGRIDEKMINKLKIDTSKSTFWVAGPEVFVKAMEKVLGKLGVTSDRVRSEDFPGY